jgi:valyl-tRNA synthetase
VLAKSLRLLHPLLPFVTEEIYGKLPNIKDELLITAPYPVYQKELANEKAEMDFAFLQDLVRQVRTLRSECTIPPDQKIKVRLRVSVPESEVLVKENTALVKLLAGIGDLEIATAASNLEAGQEARPQGSIGIAGNGFEAFVFIAEAVDIKILKQKFDKELEKDRKYVANLKARLSNGDFLKNAPPELVEGEKLKLEDGLRKIGKLESYIRDMA